MEFDNSNNKLQNAETTYALKYDILSPHAVEELTITLDMIKKYTPALSDQDPVYVKGEHIYHVSQRDDRAIEQIKYYRLMSDQLETEFAERTASKFNLAVEPMSTAFCRQSIIGDIVVPTRLRDTTKYSVVGELHPEHVKWVDEYCKNGFPFMASGAVTIDLPTKQLKVNDNKIKLLEDQGNKGADLLDSFINVDRKEYLRLAIDWYLGYVNVVRSMFSKLIHKRVDMQVVYDGMEDSGTGWIIPNVADRHHSRSLKRGDFKEIKPFSPIIREIAAHTISLFVLHIKMFMDNLPTVVIEPTSIFFKGLRTTRSDANVLNAYVQNGLLKMECESSTRGTHGDGSSFIGNTHAWIKHFGRDPLDDYIVSKMKEYGTFKTDQKIVEILHSDIYPSIDHVKGKLGSSGKKVITVDLGLVIAYVNKKGDHVEFSLGADNSIQPGAFHGKAHTKYFSNMMKSGRLSTSGQYTHIIAYLSHCLKQALLARGIAPDIEIAHTGDDVHIIFDETRDDILNNIMQTDVFKIACRIKTAKNIKVKNKEGVIEEVPVIKISGTILMYFNDYIMCFVNPRVLKTEASRTMSESMDLLNQQLASIRVTSDTTIAMKISSETQANHDYQMQLYPSSFFFCGSYDEYLKAKIINIADQNDFNVSHYAIVADASKGAEQTTVVDYHVWAVRVDDINNLIAPYEDCPGPFIAGMLPRYINGKLSFIILLPTDHELKITYNQYIKDAGYNGVKVDLKEYLFMLFAHELTHILCFFDAERLSPKEEEDYCDAMAKDIVTQEAVRPHLQLICKYILSADGTDVKEQCGLIFSDRLDLTA